MSDDISLARPAGRLTTPTPPAGHDRRREAEAWRRYFVLWDVFFGIVAAGTAGYLAMSSAPAGARIAAVALLAGQVVWYLAFGRGLVVREDDSWRGYVYQAGVLGLFAPAVAVHSATSYALFALCPLAFMTLPRLPVASAMVLILNGVWIVTYVVRSGDLIEAAHGPLPIAVMVTAFSLMLGAYIDRIIRQSRERAQLIEELESTRAELGRLSHEAGVAAERQRLAGEIHDTIAQGLSSVVMLVQAASTAVEREPARARGHLELAERTARENLAEARAVVAALTPAALESTSLVDAIARQVDRVAAEDGLAATHRVDGVPRRLPTATEVVLLRATQEALANVRRHAAAGSVDVALCFLDDAVVLEVRDDGKGFDPGNAGDGYGLPGMRARVEQVGGVLTVDSTPGAGTTVRVAT